MTTHARLCVALLAALLPAAAAAEATGRRHPVCVAIFLSNDCPHCEPVERAEVGKLARRLGCEIRTRYYSVEKIGDYARLVRLEQRFGNEGNEIPVAFLGAHCLGGTKEIEASFASLVERYAREGGAEAFPEAGPPTRPASSKPPTSHGKLIYVAYFDSPGCQDCRRVEHMLQALRRQIAALRLRTFVTSDRRSQVVQEAISQRVGIPVERRLLTPTVVVGSRAFTQAEITDRVLREHLGALAATGSPCPWAKPLDLAAAERRLFGRLRAVGLGAVVVGGLVDGVNPCAFATLILFISFMRSAGRERGRLLAVGLSFTAAVFMVYLAVGLGLSELALLVGRVPYLDAAVTWAIIVLCVVLAVLSARDALIARRGDRRAIALQLPQSVKARIRLVLVRFGRTRYLVLGGLLIGALISVLELVCTGQIYFPLIKFMVASGGHRARRRPAGRLQPVLRRPPARPPRRRVARHVLRASHGPPQASARRHEGRHRPLLRRTRHRDGPLPRPRLRSPSMRLACLAAALWLAAPLAWAAQPRPVMALSAEQWDFGIIEQGQTATKDIEVANKGDADLKITFIRSSCATCVGNLSGARLIKPGQKGKIALSFYSKGLAGRQSKVVYVHGNDPATPYRAIRIVGTVRKSARPELHVAADMLDLGLVLKRDRVVRTLTVENRGQAPLAIKAVSASDACRVRFPDAKSIGPGKKADLRITLLADKLDGLIQEHLTLHTNDPVTPSTTVTLIGYAAEPSQIAGTPARGIQIVPAGKPVAIPGTGKALVRNWRVTNRLPVKLVLLVRNAPDPEPLTLSAGETRLLPASALDAAAPADSILELSLRIPAGLPKE